MVKNSTGLAPGVTTTFAPRLGDQLAELGQAGGGTVVRVARGQRGVGRAADERGRVEIGLADAEVDDALALRLERLAAGEHIERRGGGEPAHTLRESHARPPDRRNSPNLGS